MATTTTAEAWIPSEAGDQLSGEVTHIDLVRDHPSAPPSGVLVLHIRGEDGVSRAAWGWHKVLDSQLRRHQPNVGETVTITYGGKAKPKGDGKPYHTYEVEVHGREPEPFSWDRAAAADADPEVDVPVDAGQTPAAAASAAAYQPRGGDDDIPF
jgi:hypothetical protein